ncbi:MAG TPA: hypothetical protein VNB94_10385 [Mycobacteriales bacterium]|nr:hypothetical protein [Mycobacteriales bacterium]
MILRRRGRTAPEPAPVPRAPARTEMYQGTTLTPDEGAALRVDSAADVDPNVKARGLSGIPRGDAGGYGGAGTK